MNDNAIAVVGMAARLPGARSLGEFWSNLRDGVESITRFTDEELRAAGVSPDALANADYVKAGVVLDGFDRFDAGFFGFSPRDAQIMDPQHRIFLECAWEALEHAGHDPARFPGSIGVFAGSGMTAYMTFNLAPNRQLMDDVGLFLVRHTGNDKDFLATRVSYELNLSGPSINVQTACSTSLVAIHLATQHLLNGECDMALAGGVTIELPHHVGYLFKQDEILSRDGHCRAFDADSAGTVFGSGAGIVVLRRLADAVRDGDHIHAVILGSAVNNDGAGKVGYLAPSVNGQAAAIAEAIAIAGVPAESITYVEAHGTGTPVGDPIEVAALTQAFRGAGATRRGFCALGSVKGNIGHLDTAAGVASFMKAVLALEHRQIPPTLHFKRPNTAIDFPASPFYVPAEVREWTSTASRRAGVSSLGVGGTNAHVVLQEAPVGELGSPARAWQLVVMSARTPTALDATSANLADHLRDEDTSFADLAWTLQAGRHEFAQRRFVVARDRAEAADAIESNDATRVHTGHAGSGAPSVAFMFAGGGAQHPNMARELYATEPAFRRELDRCLEVLEQHVTSDLRSLLFPPTGAEETAAVEMERPSNALPLLFAVQYAQAQLWRSWGIEPSGMIGHSMGEYTAACLAGVFSLEDALAVVALRGRLFETLPAGGMISVAMPPADLEPLLGPALSLAAVNAPELSVASGPVEALESLERTLQARDVETRRIHIAVAAHSAALEPILSKFGEYLATLTLRAPTLPFVSNLTGKMAGTEVTEPGYWVRHLRHTVRFSDGLRVLLEDATAVLLEVGPGRTLATLARLHDAVQPGQAIITSLPHPDERTSDAAFMLTALGRLWLRGSTVDWTAVHSDERRRRVVLPTYPFERQRYWIDAPVTGPAASGANASQVARRNDVEDWFWQPVWRRTPVARDAVPDARPGVLIFDGGEAEAVGDAAAALLEAEGERVVRINAGDRFARRDHNRYTLRPANADDCGSLVRDLTNDGGVPGRILHLWTFGSAADVSRDRDNGFETLVAFAQALGAEDVDGGTMIVVAASGSQQVAGEPVSSPARALSSGLLRVLAREYAGLAGRYVDIATDVPVSGERGVATRLREELRAGGADLVAYRGRERFALDFESVHFAPGDELAGLRTCGVYLITGGMGGIGSVIARELARRAQARLALVGRQALPPRTDWPLWLATHVADDDVSRRIRLVMDLEDAGAEVLPVAADLGTAEGAARAVDETRRRFGALHGVIHAAGVLDDGLLQMRTRAERDRVLAPKVDATLALDAALGSAPLDFFVSFSSVSVFAGLPGQADYAAANAFLDAHAQQRSSRAPGRALSLAWSAWKDVGMLAASGPSGDDPDTAGAEAIAVSHPVLRSRVRSGDADVFSGTMSPDTDWMLAEHRLRSGDPLIPGTGYLELARAAFEATAGTGTIEIRDVFFLKPFSVRDGESRDLSLRLTRSESSGASADFVLLGRKPGAGAWTEHARGRTTRTPSTTPARVSVEAIKARCAAVHDTTEAHPYLAFGPRWDNVRGVDYGSGEALVSLELPATFEADLAVFRLHPALLDMATAGAQRLIPGHDPSLGFFVPIGYGRVRLDGPLSRRLYSHIRYRPADGDRSDVAIFDVTIADASGTVVAEIEQFTMKRVPAEVLRMAERDDAPAAGPLVDLADAIAPAEGAAAFFRLIGSDTAAHVVVSPQPFDALLARWRVAEPARAPAAPAPVEDPALLADLERIASALREHAAVADAVAVAKKGRGTERRIIGYVVFKPNESATISELRRGAKASLPSHLVPANFIDLDELPRQPDGAVDRAALPDPFGPIDNYVAPRTEMEKAVAQVWKEVLGVDRVGVRDNFFDIGGHSLLSVRVITKLDRRFGVRLDQAIMVLQTLEQIAARCEQRLAQAGVEATAKP